jgi:hypothetical protein
MNSQNSFKNPTMLKNLLERGILPFIPHFNVWKINSNKKNENFQTIIKVYNNLITPYG